MQNDRQSSENVILGVDTHLDIGNITPGKYRHMEGLILSGKAVLLISCFTCF